MTTLYGIKNCDTVRKARKWLENNGIDYRYHDLRADGVSAELIQQWIDAVGWEPLLNRRGRSWRELDESQRTGLDADSARALMLEYPTLIKRPVVQVDDELSVGFSADAFEALFAC